jgi:hypothetical protein
VPRLAPLSPSWLLSASTSYTPIHTRNPPHHQGLLLPNLPHPATTPRRSVNQRDFARVRDCPPARSARQLHLETLETLGTTRRAKPPNLQTATLRKRPLDTCGDSKHLTLGDYPQLFLAQRSHMGDRGHPARANSQRSTPLTPTSFFKSEHKHNSDIESCANAVPETVMAEQVANDVVKEAQSVGHSAPIDDSASTTNDPAVNGDPPSGTATTKPTSPEASSSKPTANGIDTASTGSAHVSQKAQGQAGAVSRDDQGMEVALTVAGRQQAARRIRA